MSFEIGQGDLEPDIGFSLTVNGAAKNISTAASYVLRHRKPDGTVIEGLTLTAVDLAGGLVKRVWAAGDTADLGVHRGWVVVTWAGGEVQTFPSDGTSYIWFVNPVT